MKKILSILLSLFFIFYCFPQDQPAPHSDIPKMEIINESSGEMAFQNEIILTGINRNKEAEEYKNGYYETQFIDKNSKSMV